MEIDLAPLVFEERPMAEKNPEEREASPWGSG